MHRIWRGIVGLSGAAILVFGAITAPALGDTVKIGFNAPLTGFAAADGNSARLGAELAVEQINAEGGINGKKVELVIYDDQAKADQAIPIAKKLIGQDGVKIAVSGSYSGPTRAAAGVFQEAGIPYIAAYAVHPDITRAGPFVFRTSTMGEVQGRAGAKLIADIMGKKRVSIITMNNDFGKSLSEGFKSVAAKFGIEILNEYEYSLKDRQFGPIVASIKVDNPEAIYAGGYYFTAGPLISQLRAAGVKVPVIGQEGYDGDTFIKIAKDAAEGVIITTTLDRDSDVPVIRKFIQDFEAKAGFGADMVAASSHTAISIAVAAMRKAGTDDPKAIRDAVAATKNFSAATGTIGFNELGEVYKPVQVQVVRGGAWHRYAVIDDPVLMAPPIK